MTSVELRDLLVTVIAGVKEEPVAKWRKIVGDVEVLPIVFHPRSNWKVTPKGNRSQLAMVAQCVDIVRAERKRPVCPALRVM